MNSRKILLAFIGAAFIIKLLIFLFLVKEATKWEDNEVALNLLHTGEMKYFHDGNWDYNYQFPVYCFMQFIIYKTAGVHDLPLVMLQLALSSLTALLLHSIFSFFNRETGLATKHEIFRHIPLLAAIAYLFHPLITYYSIGHIHPFSMDIFMAMLVIFTSIRYYESPSPAWLILLGIITGISILERATLVTALAPFPVLLLQRFSFPAAALKVAAVSIIALALCVPWLLRNHERTGEWLISTPMGRHLWVGSLEETEGSNVADDGKNYFHSFTPQQLSSFSGYNVRQQDSAYRAMYMQKLETQPSLVARMFFVKLKNFWWFRSNTGVSYSNTVKRFIPLYKIVYGVVLLFSAIAILMLRSKSLLILSFPIAISLLQSFFYVETRHRFIIEPLLIFLAFTGIAYSILYLQEKKKHYDH